MVKDSEKTCVRHTLTSDLRKVMEIYAYARKRMRESGNTSQWVNGYPSEDIILEDIRNGNSYVIEKKGRITGVFTFIVGNDPTYDVIDGAWINNNPYGTIHRIASSQGSSGTADICLYYCRQKGIDIRIDTHADNAPMLGWIKSRGFRYCGIIYCRDKSPRNAFQLEKGDISAAGPEHNT